MIFVKTIAVAFTAMLMLLCASTNDGTSDVAKAEAIEMAESRFRYLTKKDDKLFAAVAGTDDRLRLQIQLWYMLADELSGVGRDLAPEIAPKRILVMLKHGCCYLKKQCGCAAVQTHRN